MFSPGGYPSGHLCKIYKFQCNIWANSSQFPVTPPKLTKFSDFLKKTKKRKSSDFRHGRKNPFFWKIPKQDPRGPPLGKFLQKIKQIGQAKKPPADFLKRA